MLAMNNKTSYQRASGEHASFGVVNGGRPQPTLQEARLELARELSLSLKAVLKDRYGPLFGPLSESTITEFLISLESGLARAKGDVTIFAQELLDRLALSLGKDVRNSETAKLKDFD